ncbi:MAG TPA: squalene/phytoene synthase family protein, partial [Solirubrobacterales bacterium]|nr:squalene/phytoene synthase family protein [Solirubrobacterales bacterium]
MSAAEVPDGGRSEPEVVRATARAHERDRYLAALLARGQPRDDLLALVAFAAEIGRIGSLVSEPAMGEIRLQWWRDALRNPDPATKSGHPVADLTRAAVRRHGLPPGLLIG